MCPSCIRAGFLEFETMKLIEFIDYQVKPTPEALLVKPIRKLYYADRSKRKEVFMQQMSYLYFMVDPRSTYSYIVDLDERRKAIIKQEGLPENFKPSPALEEAMQVYEAHTITSSTKLLQSTRIAVDALSEELENTKEILGERLEKGGRVTKQSEVMATIERVLKIIPQLQDLERKVEEEIKEEGRARGAKKKMFEDGVV